MTDNEFNALETECIRYLNPSWTWAFIAFMTNTDLGSTRLFAWANAFMSTTTQNDKAYKLHLTTLSKWVKVIFTKEELSARKNHLESLRASPDFEYVVNQHQLIGSALGPRGAHLIVAFEQKTETLVHHLIEREITAEAIWYVLAETQRQAVAKTSAVGVQATHTIKTPTLTNRLNCWDEVENLLTANKNTYRWWGQRLIKIDKKVWKLTAYKPLITTALDIDTRDRNEVHHILRSAAITVTNHFKKPESESRSKFRQPSWTGISRTRQQRRPPNPPPPDRSDPAE